MAALQDYQKDFVKFCLRNENVLKFGEFTLKSGRQSPYFFNAGNFTSGVALKELGEFYASAIENSGVRNDGVELILRTL
jgi:orotate phosphoribosyltransferase